MKLRMVIAGVVGAAALAGCGSSKSALEQAVDDCNSHAGQTPTHISMQGPNAYGYNLDVIKQAAIACVLTDIGTPQVDFEEIIGAHAGQHSLTVAGYRYDWTGDGSGTITEISISKA